MEEYYQAQAPMMNAPMYGAYSNIPYSTQLPAAYPSMPVSTKMPMYTTPPAIAAGATIQSPQGTVGQVTDEESYVENILRMNLGKQATIYMTFENNNQWNAKIFSGILEAAGRDHIIISDPKTGLRYLLLMVNLDYITFPEELTYSLPFGR